MKHLSTSVALAAALGVLASLPVAAAPTAADTPVAIVAETVRTEAEVVSVDAKNHALTLKLPSGDIVDLLVDNSVKNLGQVKVGDAVAAEYHQALAVKLKKSPGIRSTTESSDKVTAEPGQKPAAAHIKETNFVADVTDVDTAASTITVLGAKGNSVKLRVRDPKVLGEIKKGDQVEGSYVQAVVVAVIPKTPEKK